MKMGSFSNPCLKILLGWRQIPGSVQSDMKTLHVRAGPPAWAAPPSSKQPQYNVIYYLNCSLQLVGGALWSLIQL